MVEKIYLGKVKENYKSTIAGADIWLCKHSWDCGWYWGFGYVENTNIHTHFDGCFLGENPCTPKGIFDIPKFTEGEWWIIRDLMIQAYALKQCAEIYKYGGHQTTKLGITDVIQDCKKDEPRNRYECMTGRLNRDLKKVLDTLWAYMNKCIYDRKILEEGECLYEE